MARYQTGLPSVLVVVALVVVAFLSALTACGPTDVNSLRQNYTAELNSWFKAETPRATAATAMDPAGEGEGDAAMGDTAGDTAGDETAGDETAGDEAMAETGDEGDGMPTDMAPPMDVQQTVTLDILVKHEGGGKLPGITLDISQADSAGTEKRNWKLWVDTSDLGVVKQITKTLEDVTLEEEDGFNVEVRSFVPPEDQGEYEEFSSSPPA